MAILTPTFAEYTYYITYKEGVSTENPKPEVLLTEATRVIPSVTNVIQGGQVVTVPNPSYDYFMNTILTRMAPSDDAVVKVYRNPVASVDSLTGDTTVLAEKTLIDTIPFKMLANDKRSSFVIKDDVYSSATKNKRILVQILNVNDYEKIPSKYTLRGVNFEITPSVPQYVDISFKKASDPETEWQDVATDVKVLVTGEFDNDWAVDLDIEEDTEYELKIFHYEGNKESIYTFTSNLTPTIGPNPIIDKFEWNGRKLTFDVPGIKQGMNPTNRFDADWMFGLDYTTKSFNNISSSMWSSRGEEYGFTMKASVDDNDEVYIGSELDVESTLSLPIDYVNEKLPDNGASHNITYGTLFNSTYATDERKTLFCKFRIDPTHEGPLKLINFGGSGENYIGFDVSGSSVSLRTFGTNRTFASDKQVVKGKWYTLLLITNGTSIKYLSIIDKAGHSTASVPVGSGTTVGFLDRSKLISANKQDVTVAITYTANTVDQVNMGLALEYSLYQYEENNLTNNLITRDSSADVTILNGTRTATFTIPNDAAYGIAVGYAVKFSHGGVTSNGNVTVTKIEVNGVDVTARALTGAPVEVSPQAATYMSYSNGTVSYLATGATVSAAVGGSLFKDIAIPSLAASTRIYFGGGLNLASKFMIAKIGCKTMTGVTTDSFETNPYMYLNSRMFTLLGSSYKSTPYLNVTTNGTVTKLGYQNILELKDATVMFAIEGLPPGESTFEVMSDGKVYGTKQMTIKTLNEELSKLEYDIDFTVDFDAAVNQLIDRYYAKQKRWGGNMGGGTNGNLIYFNRGEECMILEQHGDLYEGDVSSVSPAGANGYGLPSDIIELPSTYPNQFGQRGSRVGGLVQSIDYHPYGMFDCWFNVPKGMAGLAICLWYFHYQEIYNYDKEFDFWTKTGWAGYKYEDSVESGFGATWVVINNEIDMELGSENTPYRVGMDPNLDQSMSWYVNGLSRRQMIGCDNTDPAVYGTWLLDWDASLSAINSVTVTDPLNPAAYLKSNQLVWVKVNSKLDAVNYGASNRSCRFNNWVNERWNDGTGVYGDVSKSPLGRSELSINNRTPLGQIDPKALIEAQRYVEKYYDDGRYHKWSIDWHRDYTRLLIDDEEIAVLKAFVPFNPMTMLIGCWFPSANVYDKAAILGEYGTWGGVVANWKSAQMKVNRIKFVPYTTQESPRDILRYDCETYAQDGLREILHPSVKKHLINIVPATLDYVAPTITINNKIAKYLYVDEGDDVEYSLVLDGYVSVTGSIENVRKSENIYVTLVPVGVEPTDPEVPTNPEVPVETEGDTQVAELARVTQRIDDLISTNGRSNLVIWSFMTDNHMNGASAVAPYTNVHAANTVVLNRLRTLAETYNFSCMLFGGDIVGYGDNNSASTTAISNIGAVPANNNAVLADIKLGFDLVADALASSTIPVIMTAGNHDTQGGGVQWGTYIPMSYVYENMILPYKSKLTWTDPNNNSTSCYFDDTVNKIRFASVDVFQDDNIEKWTGTNPNKRNSQGIAIVDSLPADYKLVLMQHKSMGPAFFGSNSAKRVKSYVDTADGYSSYNQYETWYDDLSARPNFSRTLIMIHGHSHVDNQALMANNKFQICTQSAAINTSSIFNSRTSNWDIRIGAEHEAGYATETAIDIFVYNKVSGNLEIIRYGAGHDRSFELQTSPPKMRYGSVKGALSSNITDYTGYSVVLTSNMQNSYSKQKKNRYKTHIPIGVKPDGTFDSDTSYESPGVTTKIGIPLNLKVRVKIIGPGDVLVHDTGVIFTTAESIKNLNTISF